MTMKIEPKRAEFRISESGDLFIDGEKATPDQTAAFDARFPGRRVKQETLPAIVAEMLPAAISNKAPQLLRYGILVLLVAGAGFAAYRFLLH
jgi:hypothetical protein